MTIKQAFEYLASECGIGMKNPFIALRNLVEGFSKVADELDPTPTGDFVKKSGDTMTGPLVVEDGVTATKFSYVEPVLGGSINLYGRPSTQEVNIEVPNKSGTMVLSSTMYNYTSAEKKVGTWIDGSDIYQKSYDISNLSFVNNAAVIDSDLTSTNCIILEYNGGAYITAGAGVSLCGIPGVQNWQIGVHLTDALVLYAGANAAATNFSGGRLLCTIKYLKKSSN